MSITTATQSEVAAVAHKLLDPLMKDVHRDVQDLRAQLVAQQKETHKLRAEYIQSTKKAADQRRRFEQLLGQVVARLVELENRR